jgi:hypothetical protein
VAENGVFWWRVPDNEAEQMSLRHAELKCYLVVVRAIQRDRNGGRLSVRQIAKRAKLSPRHTYSAVAALLDRGILLCDVRPGSTAEYRLPVAWRNCTPTGQQSNGADGFHVPPNCAPTGIQLSADGDGEGQQHCAPTGEQHCTPTGQQHLESSEYSESSSSSTQQLGRFVDPVEVSPATTTTREYLNGKSQPEPWPWPDGDREQAREALRAHFGALMLPDLDLTREVLAHMQGLSDVRLWLWDLTERRVKRKGWGFYPYDAQNWPRRRADVQGQVDAQRAVMEAEARATDEANATAAREAEAAMQVYEQQQRAQQEFIDAAEAQGWPRDSKSLCLFCFGFGRRDVGTGALCDCESGRKLRLKLEQDRARVRNNPAAPKSAEPPPTREQRPAREPARHRHSARGLKTGERLREGAGAPQR